MITLLSRLRRRIVVDTLALVIAFWLAYLLRFDFAIPREDAIRALYATPFVVLLQIVAIRRYGIHRVVGKYISFDDLVAFIWAAIFWLVPMLGVRMLLPAGPWRIPISVSLIDTVLAVAGLLGIRWLQRMQAEGWITSLSDDAALAPVLLFGAGDAGAQVAHQIRRGDTGLRVLGFVDDDPTKHGAVISGCEVLGNSDDLPELVRRLEIDHVIVTIVDAPASVLHRITALCRSVPVKVRTVPSLLELVRGSVAITKFRDVSAEDLLGRDPVDFDLSVLQDYLSDRVVLVTGAGGSIGSELARQVAAIDPRQLLLVERFEGSLFDIHREILGTHPAISILPLVADVTDKRRMEQIFRDHSPDVVVHAAAHKHVAMMETNVAEAVKNNSLGTEVVAQLAGEHQARSFVLVSTDKAVRPTSVMGASKRVAEMLVQRYDLIYQGTRFNTVRFGNVLGSSGSVIPIFKEQLQSGGPLTVTHEDATRYFMTIPEASRLVLTAGAIGEGGEIMVLDMGSPVRIIDLARNLIELSGFVPHEDVSIKITGLKPGEKVSEELYWPEEALKSTRHAKIFVGPAENQKRVGQLIQRLRVELDNGDSEALRRALHEAIPGSRLIVAEDPVPRMSQDPSVKAVKAETTVYHESA